MSKLFYRTKDGRADYQFSFEQTGSGWRAYIVDMPSYSTHGYRATDAHSTHRLSDGSRRYVCWSAPLRTEAEARQVASKWADYTQEYIRTGRTIDEQVRSGR